MKLLKLNSSSVPEEVSVGDPGLSVYVDGQTGSDSTGDGSILRPYLTFGHAHSVITDAASTKIYAIILATGIYSEGTISLKPYINIVGRGTSTSLEFTQLNLHASWLSQSATVEARFKDLIMSIGAPTWDFGSATSTVSITMEGCFFTGSPFWVKGAATHNVTVSCFNTQFSGDVLLDGTASSGNITLNMYGGSSINLTINGNGGSGSAIINLISALCFGNIVADGVNTQIIATNDSLPGSFAFTFTTGASLFRLSDAWGMAYNPNNSADWPVTPVNVQDGLDLLAAPRTFITFSPINTTARNALTATAGMQIFNSDTSSLQYYNGLIWVAV